MLKNETVAKQMVLHSGSVYRGTFVFTVPILTRYPTTLGEM